MPRFAQGGFVFIMWGIQLLYSVLPTLLTYSFSRSCLEFITPAICKQLPYQDIGGNQAFGMAERLQRTFQWR